MRWGLHRLVTVERIGVRLGLIEHAAAIYAGRVAIAAARYRMHPPLRHRPAERVIRAAARRESAAGPERTYCDGERQGRGVILAQLPASNRQVKPSRTAGRTNFDFRHYPLRRRPPPPLVLRLHQLVTNVSTNESESRLHPNERETLPGFQTTVAITPARTARWWLMGCSRHERCHQMAVQPS